MSKQMTLDVLSSIKGAKASKVVDELFEVIKKGQVDSNSTDFKNLAVEVDELRADEVRLSTELERSIIIENFPKEKNNYLVMPKVIEE